MSEFKGTPGPWCLSDETPLIVKKDFYGIGSNGGPLIASAMGNDSSGFYATESEAVANAQLIAAAPELLEDLIEAKALVEFLANHLVGRMGEGALTDMAIKADNWGDTIAKALGEESV